MQNLYVLDACALIAFLRQEQGTDKVKEHFDAALTDECKILIHKVTIVEALYDQKKADSTLDLDYVLTSIMDLPLTVTASLEDNFIKTAALYKVDYRISFADCFVLALAKLEAAKVITSDHHEFEAIERRGELQFEWFR